MLAGGKHGSQECLASDYGTRVPPLACPAVARGRFLLVTPAPSPALLFIPAMPADAGDHQPVAGYLEFVLPGDGFAQLIQAFAVELEEPAATLAVEMVVPRVAVGMLVDGAAAEIHRAEHPGFDQFAQRAVDGRPADAALGDEFGQMLE